MRNSGETERLKSRFIGDKRGVDEEEVPKRNTVAPLIVNANPLMTTAGPLLSEHTIVIIRMARRSLYDCTVY